MDVHSNEDVRGFTLLELLVALAVMGTLLGFGHHWWQESLPRHRVVAASNQVLGLIHRARAEAMTRGPIYLCDGNSLCDRFDTTQDLLLAYDTGDGSIKTGDVFQRLRLPTDTTLAWRRFRGEALRYEARGNLHYQNGHFLICNRHQARKVIMTVMGTARIETTDADNCP